MNTPQAGDVWASENHTYTILAVHEKWVWFMADNLSVPRTCEIDDFDDDKLIERDETCQTTNIGQ